MRQSRRIKHVEEDAGPASTHQSETEKPWRSKAPAPASAPTIFTQAAARRGETASTRARALWLTATVDCSSGRAAAPCDW